jgi:hypothetical protein
MHNIAARRKAETPDPSDTSEAFVNIASRRGKKSVGTSEPVSSAPATKGIEQAMVSIGEQKAEHQRWFARLCTALVVSVLAIVGIYLAKSGIIQSMYQAAMPVFRDFFVASKDVAPSHCAAALQSPFGNLAETMASTLQPLFRLLAVTSMLFGFLGFIRTGEVSRLVPAIALAPVAFFLPTMLSIVTASTC